MMKRLLCMLLLILPATAACLVPQDGMHLNTSVELCTDVYYLDSGLSISGTNITIDCNGAVIKSWQGGTGVSIHDSSNLTLNGCRIHSYDVAIAVENSRGVLLNNNHILLSKIGTSLRNVTSSATLNHDVSLVSAFQVNSSTDNVLSLMNKRVEGEFCAQNFCNEKKNAVAEFVSGFGIESSIPIAPQYAVSFSAPTKLSLWTSIFSEF